MAVKRICSIDGCDKTSRSRGWCKTHYDRWRLNGSPTAGRAFKGAPQLFIEYAATFQGDECLTWPYSRTQKGGYGKLRIDGKDCIASRVVCETVYGPPPSDHHQAAHSCGKGNEGCVNARHLRWASPTENQRDRIVHGTDTAGDKNGSAKLNAHLVDEMRSLFAGNPKITVADVGKRFGVSKATAAKIKNNQLWTR